MRFGLSAILRASTAGLRGLFPLILRALSNAFTWSVLLELKPRLGLSIRVTAGSEDNVGKWASQSKRGTSFGLGSLQPPGPPPGDWTAVTGGVGVITVTRFAALPNGASGLTYRAIDTTTGNIPTIGAALAGLVSGRIYKVQASWVNAAALQLSDWSPAVLVAAG